MKAVLIFIQALISKTAHHMPTVLIVEDKKNIRTLIAVNLKARGYDTLESETAEGALPLLRDQAPDVMLLDISLPGMDGWELLEIVEGENGVDPLPVAIITGTPPSAKTLGSYYANIVDIVVKPLRVQQLMEVVEKALARA
jgi:CheY-like chemotaxis protein